MTNEQCTVCDEEHDDCPHCLHDCHHTGAEKHQIVNNALAAATEKSNQMLRQLAASEPEVGPRMVRVLDNSLVGLLNLMHVVPQNADELRFIGMIDVLVGDLTATDRMRILSMMLIEDVLLLHERAQFKSNCKCEKCVTVVDAAN